MAVYKVPQDVEAEDKLIGPFSFRQFIYLIIVAISIALAWFLSRLFIGLVVLPLPLILFFGALALPLRKDQSMEIYLAAMVKFYLKPKKRMWDPDGQFSRVTISAPTAQERLRTKEFGRHEAGQRLEYLAQVIDTQGLASRGVTTTSDHSLNPDINAEARTASDVFSEDDYVGKKFSNLIEQQEETRRQQTLNQFQQDVQSPPETIQPKSAQDYVTFPGQPKPDSFAALNSSPSTGDPSTSPVFNPYPQMRQRVIDPSGTPTPSPQPAPAQPESTQPQVTTPDPQPQATSPQPATTSNEPQVTDYKLPTPSDQASISQPSPDIIRLASNNDLSIDAIAREAHRIEQKNNDQEVVISLR